MKDDKKTTLQDRLNAVQKELTSVKTDLREFAKSGRMPQRRTDLGPMQRPASFSRPAAMSAAPPALPAAAKAAHPPAAQEGDKESGHGLKPRDERFVDYLSASIQVGRPLRSVRQRQRNKTLAFIIVLVLVALWVVGKFLS